MCPSRVTSDSIPGTSSQLSLQGSSVRTAGVFVQYLRLPGLWSHLGVVCGTQTVPWSSA